MLARQERTLAIDGVYIHVRSSIITKARKWQSSSRSCHPQTGPKRSLIVERQCRTISRASFNVNSPRNRRHFSRSLCNGTAGASATTSRRIRQNLRVSWGIRYCCLSELIMALGEIVQTLRMLKSHLDRSSTVNRLRRSRQVV